MKYETELPPDVRVEMFKSRRPAENLLNRRFRRLKVIKHLGGKQWLCQFKCGTTASVSTADLLKLKAGSPWRTLMLAGIWIATSVTLFFALAWLFFGVAVILHPGEVPLTDFWEYDYNLPLMVAFVLGGLAAQRAKTRWNRRGH